MVKVTAHGRKFSVQNPADPKEWTPVTNVVFQEEGRPDFGSSVARSSNVLSQLLGKKVGLKTVRTHTQPIPDADLGNFEPGTEHNLFINRILTSTPQMASQENVMARNYDYQPTYFVTELGTFPEPDRDMRVGLNSMIQLNPHAVLNARTRVAAVKGDNIPGQIAAPQDIIEEGAEHVDLNKA